MHIAIIGDIFCDIVASKLPQLPKWGEDSLAPIHILPGGSALNTTLHCAQFIKYMSGSIEVVLHSAVGNDSQATICCEALQKDHIRTNIIEVPNNRTGTCLVLSGSSDRAFVTDRGCIDDMTLAWFEIEDIFASGVNHLHCAGFYNCGAMAIHWQPLLEMAKQRNITTSLNPQFDATGAWGGIYDLCPMLDFLICNKDEALAITRKGIAGEAAFEMLRRGCKFVVITDSARGVDLMYLSGNETSGISIGESSIVVGETTGAITGEEEQRVTVIHEDACVIQEMVDSTGAGDAFVGGFLARLKQSHYNDKRDIVVNDEHSCKGYSCPALMEYSTKQLQDALRAGCLAGACAVQVVGGSCTLSVQKMREISTISACEIDNCCSP